MDSQTYAQLGEITRNLSQALQALGLERPLLQVTQEIPDARERLLYVGQMTEQAAHKVIALVEDGMARNNQARQKDDELAAMLLRQASRTPSAAVYQAMMRQCAAYAQQQAALSEAQNALLTDILMAQTFQDLSGQVIKKVVDIISHTETQLLTLLQSAQTQAEQASPAPTLQGPQVADKALQQNDVDDLLSSLGF